MSQAENQVRWCLDKARKELQKGKTHRGLVKGEVDIAEAKMHIAKAEHDFNAITYMDKGGFSDWSISAVFYCIYHCFLAIALKFGYKSRNQKCTIALIKMLKENKNIDIDENLLKHWKAMMRKKEENLILSKKENFILMEQQQM